MRKLSVLSALLLLFALLPDSASACRGDICKLFQDVPIVNKVGGDLDNWIAAAKDRGSSADVLNQATSMSAWNNPFRPAQATPPPEGQYKKIEYKCTIKCTCAPRTGDPILMERDAALMFFNECGQPSSGEALSPTALRADTWHLTVVVKDDGKTLAFSNGSVWELR